MKRFFKYAGLGLLLLIVGYVAYGFVAKALTPRPDLDLPAAPKTSYAARPLSEITMPPFNPMAAQGVFPMPHAEPAQQDATALPGPMDRSRRLADEEKQYVHLGPGYFGAYTTGKYADGTRLLWANGVNGLYKIDEETYEIYDHLPTPEAREYTREWAEGITAGLNDDNGTWGLIDSVRAIMPLTSLSGIYAVVGKNGWIYLANKDGSILAYGDAVEGDPRSKIELKAKFKMPEGEAGPSVGMNMTFDGWIVFPTENGYLVAVSQDLKQYRSIRIKHADTEDTSNKGVGNGWIRNSIAIDEAGGIYVASRNHMHKVMWNGDQFSVDEKDGAWTAEYRNGTGAGTGATPSLMGFGDEDKFVVITDGDIRMNVTLFWRDDIPDGWKAPEGAPSRRIAGLAPATMGELDVQAIQSEQSVIVAGYGALVVNNNPRNMPFFLPEDRYMLGFFIGPLGSNPKFQPYGVQKFQWNPDSKALETAWVNEKVSSPNGVPWVSLATQQVYLIGARGNEWTLEAIDWRSGKSSFHYIIGGQKWNSEYSGPIIDEQGRVPYGTMFGRARIQPKTGLPANDLRSKDAASEVGKENAKKQDGEKL